MPYPIESSSYSKIVSWFAFLHIKDQKHLFAKCHQVLQPK